MENDWHAEGKVCAFSGYRPPKLPFLSEDDPGCAALKLRIRDEIYTCAEQGYTDFLCGMALGCDTWAAEAVLEIRRQLAPIKTLHLHAYLPFPEQAQHWSAKHRARHRRILQKCASVTCVCNTYVPDCMHRRNQAMIDRADRLIAVFDGKKGGTFNTILMAHEKGIELRILSPVGVALTQQNEPQTPPDEPELKLF